MEREGRVEARRAEKQVECTGHVAEPRERHRGLVLGQPHRAPVAAEVDQAPDGPQGVQHVSRPLAQGVRFAQARLGLRRCTSATQRRPELRQSLGEEPRHPARRHGLRVQRPPRQRHRLPAERHDARPRVSVNVGAESQGGRLEWRHVVHAHQPQWGGGTGTNLGVSEWASGTSHMGVECGRSEPSAWVGGLEIPLCLWAPFLCCLCGRCGRCAFPFSRPLRVPVFAFLCSRLC